VPSADKLPVLKMPADLALPTLRILTVYRTEDERRSMLTALRPGTPTRTLLNAYVLPSLTELGLYDGTLRSGDTTRYGRAIAEAPADKAKSLMARRLVGMDAARVGLVDWLDQLSPRGERKRLALRHFINEVLGVPEAGIANALDRLGKWAGYLLFFDVIRESRSSRGVLTWTVNRRHLTALSSVEVNDPSVELQSSNEKANALLGAYARTSQQLGTRLYLPIATVRDELGRELQPSRGTLLDAQLDEILRQAPAILDEYVVSFSPFSGPSRGGLKLDNMYAGFISIRARPVKASSND
jgi:hypothetical protein